MTLQWCERKTWCKGATIKANLMTYNMKETAIRLKTNSMWREVVVSVHVFVITQSTGALYMMQLTKTGGGER